jgi:HPt (histidine-containing phosphotransfer) domain-containing protein
MAQLLNQSSGPIFVKMTAELAEYVPIYFEARKQDVQRLKELLGKKQFSDIRVCAHNLKGTGATFGFPDVTRLGTALEYAARSSDAALADLLIQQLGQYLERVQLRPAS